jgi:hypothetical protein
MILSRILWLCSQGSDGYPHPLGQNILFLFFDIMNISNLLAWEFDCLKCRVFAEDLAQSSWETKLGEAWEEDIKWERRRCNCFLRHYRASDPRVNLAGNLIRSLGLVP